MGIFQLRICHSQTRSWVSGWRKWRESGASWSIRLLMWSIAVQIIGQTLSHSENRRHTLAIFRVLTGDPENNVKHDYFSTRFPKRKLSPSLIVNARLTEKYFCSGLPPASTIANILRPFFLAPDDPATPPSGRVDLNPRHLPLYVIGANTFERRICNSVDY